MTACAGLRAQAQVQPGVTHGASATGGSLLDLAPVQFGSLLLQLGTVIVIVLGTYRQRQVSSFKLELSPRGR